MYAKMAIARLLLEIAEGHREAADSIVPLINDELRMMLVRQLTPASGETNIVDVADLVNQAYANLVKADYRLNTAHRIIFLSFAAQSMRRILVNFVQNCLAEANCEAQPVIVLNAVETTLQFSLADFLPFHSALDDLSRRNEDQGKLAEMCLFGGLTAQEMAELPEKSFEMAVADLEKVKNWLQTQKK